jgi:sulfate adenylyltransferase
MNPDDFVSGGKIEDVTKGSPSDTWDYDLQRIFADAREIMNETIIPFPSERSGGPQPVSAARGIVLFFTGLSGAGKSTIANSVLSRILRLNRRRAILLDGDLVRLHLSADLGFSREHRDINIRRIGYVASEIARRGGIAICAAIAPYDRVRKEVRARVQRWGGFVLIHVATPLEVCERRDPKGLYARARSGMLQHFTGVSDPYEPPEDAELVIDTTNQSAEATAELVLSLLDEGNYLLKLDLDPISSGSKLTEKMAGDETNS